MDDAYNFLRHHNLTGNHCTERFPPTMSKLDNGLDPSSFTHHDDFHDHESHIQDHSAPKLFVWSDADEAGLSRLSKVYSDHFSRKILKHIELRASLENLAFTLAIRRSSLSWRSFLVADSMASLNGIVTNLTKPVRSMPLPILGFVFTGQGAQWYKMGRELLLYPIFENSIRNG